MAVIVSKGIAVPNPYTYWEKYTTKQEANYTTTAVTGTVNGSGNVLLRKDLTPEISGGTAYWRVKYMDVSQCSTYPYYGGGDVVTEKLVQTLYGPLTGHWSGAYQYSYRYDIVGLKYVKGSYVENVRSVDPIAYPDDGEQDGYWYVKVVG